MELSPGEGDHKARGEDQKHDVGPGQVYYTRPQDSQVQWYKNTTFSRDVILIIWRRSILVHLRAMNKDEFLSIVDSALQRVSPHSSSSRALRWLSHATITDSGNVKVSMHTKDSKELDILTEDMITGWSMHTENSKELDTLTQDMITGWARTLHDEAEQSSMLFEALVPNFPANPTDLEDSDRKAVIIERLVRNNGSRMLSLTRPGDNYNIRTANSGGEVSRRTAIVLVFNSC